MVIEDADFEGIRRDEDAAWTKLASAMRTALRAKTVERVSESEADDVLQDVFVRVYGNLDQIKDAAHLENFVWRVWRQRCVDWYRKRKETTGQPMPPKELDDEDGADAQTGADPSDTESNPERLAALDDLRAELHDSAWLADDEKLVVALHVLDGLTFPRIARALQKQVKQVESVYYRALRSLRKEMGLKEYREAPSQFHGVVSEQQSQALDLLLAGLSEKKTAKRLGLSVPELAELLEPAYEALGKAAREEWERILDFR